MSQVFSKYSSACWRVTVARLGAGSEVRVPSARMPGAPASGLRPVHHHSGRSPAGPLTSSVSPLHRAGGVGWGWGGVCGGELQGGCGWCEGCVRLRGGPRWLAPCPLWGRHGCMRRRWICALGCGWTHAQVWAQRAGRRPPQERDRQAASGARLGHWSRWKRASIVVPGASARVQEAWGRWRLVLGTGTGGCHLAGQQYAGHPRCMTTTRPCAAKVRTLT